MLMFHFCELYEKKVQYSNAKEHIYAKFDELKSYTHLRESGSVRHISDKIILLKSTNPSSRSIIQKEDFEIDGKIRTIFYVRDFVTSKYYDLFWKNIYPILKNGNWLITNPIPEKDRMSAIERYKNETNKVNKPNNPPPFSLTKWTEDFNIELNHEIFEHNNWVKYALSRSTTEGMLDAYVESFRLLLNDIFNGNEKGSLLNDNGVLFVEKYNRGIIFTTLWNENNTENFLLLSGANIDTQKEYWEKMQKEFSNFQSKILSISDLNRIAFRAYPKWAAKDEQSWFSIQKSRDSNLSLTTEQIELLQKFKFPFYINGQAGSGKSTMLGYLFAHIYTKKKLGEIDGEIIYITENETLLKQSANFVVELLQKNAEIGIWDIEEAQSCRDTFKSFKSLLKSLLPESEKNNFEDDKYLSFSKFKELYESSYIKRDVIYTYSAEEVWFCINTTIYGYDVSKKIDSYLYKSFVHAKSRYLSDDRFDGIEKFVLPFYDKLINVDGYWDKLKIIRYLENYQISIPKYHVIICDEAQDFCKVELNFILKLSEYLKYHLSNTKQIPIVFAGDPNQTVNPNGFRQDELTGMIYESLKRITEFEYSKDSNIYNPKLNYRSIQAVVTFANFIQYFRKKYLKVTDVFIQESKTPEINSEHNFNLFLSYEDIEKNDQVRFDLIEKVQYKVFIVPCDSEVKDEFIKNHLFLQQLKDVEVKTSVDAKGVEYHQVVLYGFGEYFVEKFENIDNNIDSFQQKFFFNKLYVAITRAQTELIVIDSQKSKSLFWDKLIDHAVIEDHAWEDLNKYKGCVLLEKTDSINNILTSTKEDAESNALKDKEQGIYDQNPARLIVAANQYFKISKDALAHDCMGIAETIKGNLKKAAYHYLNEKLNKTKLEEAADCFFKGRFFKELISEIGNNLKSYRQDVRLVMARLVEGEKLMSQDIACLFKNLDILDLLLTEINWKNDFMSVLIENSKSLIEFTQKKQMIVIFEKIKDDTDNKVFELLADLYFQTANDEKAMEYWDRLGMYAHIGFFSARLNVAKKQENFEDIVISLSELARLQAEKKINYFNEIIFTYNNLKENIKSIENLAFYLAVYEAMVFTSKLDIEFAKKCEIAFADSLQHLIIFFESLLNIKGENLIYSAYILERWAKNYWILNKENDTNEWIETLNIQNKIFCNNFNIPFFLFDLHELEKIPQYPISLYITPNNHFNSILIQNFRQFVNLEIKNIGQFNLIVGDNNTGKTSLLEALMINSDYQNYIMNLAVCHINRCNLMVNDKNEFITPTNFLDDFINKPNKDSFRFVLSEKRYRWEYQFEVNNIGLFDTADLSVEAAASTFKIVVNSQFVFSPFPLLKTIPSVALLRSSFIPFGKGFDPHLAQIYSDFFDKKKNERERFIRAMKIFIPTIERIIPDNKKEVVSIEESEYDSAFPLHRYGEGANKLFRILVQMALNKNGRILIDEIDAGIHFSHFKEFWKIILLTAIEYNIQVFASTHNFECIKYFNEVLKDNNFDKFQDDSRIITMRFLPDKSVKAYVRTYNEFGYEIDNDFEIRGGEEL